MSKNFSFFISLVVVTLVLLQDSSVAHADALLSPVDLYAPEPTMAVEMIIGAIVIMTYISHILF